MDKEKGIKFWRAILGIATEIAMSLFIMAVALGLSWLIIRFLKLCFAVKGLQYFMFVLTVNRKLFTVNKSYLR